MRFSRCFRRCQLRRLGRALIRDRLFWVVTATLVVVGLPYRPEALRSLFSENYADLVVLPLVIFVLVRHLGGLAGRERRFWLLWGSGLGAWLLVRLAYAVVPVSWLGMPFDLATDCAYIVFYLLLAIAAVLAPHRVEVARVTHQLRRLQLIGATVLVFGLLIYFALIPGHAKPELYRSWLPSFDLYITLDVTLAVIYAGLAFTCRQRRWATLYLLLAATCCGWVVVDSLEGLAYANLIDPSAVAWPDLVWNVPLFFLVAAARGRALLPAQTDADSTLARMMAERRIGSPLLLTAVALPGLHLGLHAFEWLDRDLQPMRELLLLVAVGALTVLALAEHRLLQRYLQSADRQRREAERWAIERTTYLDALIDHSPLAIISLDANYKVRVSNPAFEQLFGYRDHEIVGRRVLSKLMPPDGKVEAREITRAVLAGERVTRKVLRRHRDGHDIEVEVYATALAIEGRLIGILVSYRDLREQTRAESARKAVEQRLRRLTEAAFEGIAVLRGTHITDASEQLASLFGFAAGELTGSDLGAQIAPPHGPEIADLLVRARQGPVEIACIRRDQTTFRAEIRARMLEEEGDGTCVLAVHDLTERLELEAQLQQAQKMEAIGRLAGGIAHDFNNLLTVILGRSELLLDQVDPASRSSVEEIKHAGDLAASLTRKLLVFARKQEPRPEQLDLNAVTATTAETMLRRLIPETVDLTLELAPEVAPIRADRSQIEQLVLNLALNAQDAMPAGGCLRIATEMVQLDEGLSGFGLAVPPGAYLCLTVGDTGVGIAPELVPRLFDPFFTTKDAGTGLGLATVYGIVRQSGGAIRVDSDPGSGTSFRVYLPGEEQTEPRATAVPEPIPPPPEPGSDERRKVVLVVEDVPEIGTMMSGFLERQGYYVMLAVRPRQALALAEEHEGPIDLLVTDVVMPEMSGPELARTLYRSRPTTKVLFVSGYAHEALRKQIDEDNSAFLRKPFSLADLSEQVRSLLADATATV